MNSNTLILIALIAGIAYGAASCGKALTQSEIEREKTKRLELLIKAGYTNHLNQIQ